MPSSVHALNILIVDLSAVWPSITFRKARFCIKTSAFECFSLY